MIYTPVNGAAANATYQINGTVLTYHIYCSTDFSANVENPNITDIQILYRVATLDDCITLCASYNYALSSIGNPEWSQLCSGVAYTEPEATWSASVRCYLKSGVRKDAVNLTVPGEVDSAVLQW
jgi:hypothetical protein